MKKKKSTKNEFLNNMLKDCRDRQKFDNHLLYVLPNNYEANILKIRQLFISSNKYF